MKAVIIEDEPRQRLLLTDLLAESFPQLKIIGDADSVNKGITLLPKLKPDLVFMDVIIRGGTSFDILDKLEVIDFHIVFTTSHEKYALKAFRQSAVDYLLKPVMLSELKEAMEKVMNKELGKHNIDQIKLLVANYSSTNNASNKIAIPDTSGFIFVNPENIVRCQSDNTYTTFYFDNRKPLVVSKTMKHCEGLLVDFGFYRIHNRAIVNLAHIQKFDRGDGGHVILSDGAQVEVSRRRKEAFLNLWKRSQSTF